jgi:FAD/FMN-containing dehydrogenase
LSAGFGARHSDCAAFTAICGFADLQALVEASRELREMQGVAALELIDARASQLTAAHLGVPAPVDGQWQLLIKLAADTDQTERLATALADARLCGQPAVGVDIAARQRLWRVRESIAEILGLYGPPMKFDVSLPVSAIPTFATESTAALSEHVPEAIPVVFGHVGEGNLHLNVLRCLLDAGGEGRVYSAMMELITGCGGNVSSEHGVGTRKRGYLGLSRSEADIGAMRVIKHAFDPHGYLNPAVPPGSAHGRRSRSTSSAGENDDFLSATLEYIHRLIRPIRGIYTDGIVCNSGRPVR